MGRESRQKRRSGPASRNATRGGGGPAATAHSGLSADTLKKYFGHLLIRLGGKRIAIRQKHLLNLAAYSTPEDAA
jgi:hypothetical protein